MALSPINPKLMDFVHGMVLFLAVRGLMANDVKHPG